ncbi:MAG: inositol oxygenase family protein [Casimicrobiaceae bacterium]
MSASDYRVNTGLNFRWTMGERSRPAATQQGHAAAFARGAEAICLRHRQQTPETVAALRRKYEAPVFGRVPVWSLVEKLAQCIDPTDLRLYTASQQMHVLQIIAGMEAEGVASDELVLAALVHDLGKVLLLTDEAPENIVCFNEPIGRCEPGVGLDNCVLQWNHDEFAYSRLKPYLPDGIAWLVRYHSIVRQSCDVYMDARDREYAARYLSVFERYDHGTKSPYFLPARRIDAYRHVLAAWLPETIVF